MANVLSLALIVWPSFKTLISGAEFTKNAPCALSIDA